MFRRTALLLALFSVSLVSLGQCPEELWAGPTDSNCHLWNFEIGSSVGNPQVIWNFGDGTEGTAGHFIEHVFVAPGTYEVCATFVNAGCPNGVTHCTTIEVICDCIPVVLNFDSGTNEGGPLYVQWLLAESGTGVLEQGFCQFSEMDPLCDVELCLEIGCYTFTVIAPGSIAPWEVDFSMGLTIDDEEDMQLFGEYNEENQVYTFDFGVNIDCYSCGLAVESIEQQDNILVLQALDFPENAIVHWTQNGENVNQGNNTTFVLQPGNNEICAMYETPECPQAVFWCESFNYQIAPDCPEDWVIEEFECGSYLFTIPGSSDESTVFWNLGSQYITNNGEPVTIDLPNGVHQVYAIYQAPGCPPTTFIEGIEVDCNFIGCPSEVNAVQVNDCGTFYFTLNNFPAFGEIVWNWGDGATSSGANNVNHAYPMPGVYQVCAEAWTDDCSEGVEVCFELVVESCDIECPEGIEVVELGCGLYGFEVGSAASVDFAVWAFGDGQVSDDGHYVEHQFTEPGIYVISVNTGLTIPCFNNYFIVTIEVQECEEECSVVNLLSVSSGFATGMWISDSDQEVVYEDECGDATCLHELCLSDGCYYIYLTPNAPGDLGLTAASEMADVSVELLSEGNATNLYLLSVNSNCGDDDCQFEIEAQTVNGVNYGFSASDFSLTPQNWVLPNGSTWQGPGAEFAFEEPGVYTVCAYYFSEECGELEDCIEIIITEDDCTEVWIAMDSNLLLGGPAEAVWNLAHSGGDVVDDGEVFYTPNQPYFDYENCLPDGCYEFTVTAFGVQVSESFDILFGPSWEIVSQEISEQNFVFTYTYLLSLNGDCAPEGCDLEIEAVTVNGWDFYFSTATESELLAMSWEMPDGTFISGSDAYYTFTQSGVYEVCAFNESAECGLVADCIEVEVSVEDCYPTVITIEAALSETDIQILEWYLEAEGLNEDGEIIITDLQGSVSFTVCLPADCYELTFETPGGILNAIIAATINVTVNGASVLTSDWPAEAESYTIQFGVMEDCGDAINELLSDYLLIYPNPAVDQLMVSIPSDWVGATANMTDAAGRTIESMVLTGPISTLNASNLASGLYRLTILSENRSHSGTIQILR